MGERETVTQEPNKPTDVQAETQTKTSIELRWKKPLPISLVVDEYMIEVKGSKSYWPKYSFSETYTQNGARTNMVIDSLVPGTSYEFWVTASAVCGKSEKSVSSKKDTDIDNPVKPTGNYVALKDKFDVPLWSVDPVNGPISSYQVIVIKGNKDVSDLPTNISGYKDAQELYVTAELKPNEIKSSFPVGDNKIYGQYKNVPLDKGKTYTIAERAITEHEGKLYAGQAAVVARIEVTQDPPEYSNSTIWVLEGDEVTLGCYTSGPDPIKYSWTKRGTPSLDSVEARANGDDLIIRLKSDKEFGIYVCTATNSEGTVVYRINRVELKKYMTRKPNASEIKAKEVVSYVIPLVLIILGLIICIVYLVYRLRRKEKQHNEKRMKSKSDEKEVSNDVINNPDYADDIIKNSRKPQTTTADEIETSGYMELQPIQSSDTVYQSIQEPANRPRKSETPHTRGMTGHEQYMDLKPRVNEYETLHHKENAPGQDYEDVGQDFTRNISSHDTQA
ncbi:uncharacterized protein LOC116294358 [Actinia tenebrosa]|uniref:Uncharacterized protein LOC116294358 n=1 Tax=Actinia tenebrosa TaxID=6105 RepID=A0A6P8HYX1_ACTTE|nr:uncharacterized protein LOC116294358 [Actinia tenebrosa]